MKNEDKQIIIQKLHEYYQSLLSQCQTLGDYDIVFDHYKQEMWAVTHGALDF